MTSASGADNNGQTKENIDNRNTSIASTSSSAYCTSNSNGLQHYVDYSIHNPPPLAPYPNPLFDRVSPLRQMLNLPIPNSSFPYLPAYTNRPIANQNPYLINRYRYPLNVSVSPNARPLRNANVFNTTNLYETNKKVRGRRKRSPNPVYPQTAGLREAEARTPFTIMKRPCLSPFAIQNAENSINSSLSYNNDVNDLPKQTQALNFKHGNALLNIAHNYNRNMNKFENLSGKSVEEWITGYAFQTLAYEIIPIHPLFQLPDEGAMVSVSQPKTMEDVCLEVHKQIIRATEQKQICGGLIFDYNNASGISETGIIPTDKCDEMKNNFLLGKDSDIPLIKNILIGRAAPLNSPASFYCPFCRFKSEAELYVRIHVLKHARVMSVFNCPLCILCFDDYDSVRNHASVFHQVDEDSLKQVIILTGEKKWISGDSVDDPTVPLEPLYPNLTKLRNLLKLFQSHSSKVKQNGETSSENITSTVAVPSIDQEQPSNRSVSCNQVQSSNQETLKLYQLPIPQVEQIGKTSSEYITNEVAVQSSNQGESTNQGHSSNHQEQLSNNGESGYQRQVDEKVDQISIHKISDAAPVHYLQHHEYT